MKKVTANTQMLVQALVETFTVIGSDKGTNDGGFWWWEKSSFEKGLDIVKKIAEPYEKLGKGIKQIIEIVGSLDSKSFAGKISDIISVFTTTGEKGDLAMFVAATGLAEKLGTTFEKMGKAIPAIAGAKVDPKIASAIRGLIFGQVDEGQAALGYFNQMKMHQALSQTYDKAGTNFPKIQGAINSLDLTKLTESRKMFEALAVLSKGGNPGDILAQMGQSLEEALKNLAEMLENFRSTVQEGNEQNAGVLEKVGNTVSKAFGGGGGDAGQGKATPSIKFPDKMQVSLDQASINAIKANSVLGGGRG